MVQLPFLTSASTGRGRLRNRTVSSARSPPATLWSSPSTKVLSDIWEVIDIGVERVALDPRSRPDGVRLTALASRAAVSADNRATSNTLGFLLIELVVVAARLVKFKS